MSTMELQKFEIVGSVEGAGGICSQALVGRLSSNTGSSVSWREAQAGPREVVFAGKAAIIDGATMAGSGEADTPGLYKAESAPKPMWTRQTASFFCNRCSAEIRKLQTPSFGGRIRERPDQIQGQMTLNKAAGKEDDSLQPTMKGVTRGFCQFTQLFDHTEPIH